MSIVSEKVPAYVVVGLGRDLDGRGAIDAVKSVPFHQVIGKCKVDTRELNRDAFRILENVAPDYRAVSVPKLVAHRYVEVESPILIELGPPRVHGVKELVVRDLGEIYWSKALVDA